MPSLHRIILLQIPVFKGLAGPLVGAFNTLKDHFGTDGLGDVLNAEHPVGWKDRIQKEHAVTAMIRLVSENPGQVTVRMTRYESTLLVKGNHYSKELCICL